jgi:hypothetical protein
MVSDRCLIRVGSFYPTQYPIQKPRNFRAYVGAIGESNREASGVVNNRSQQEMREWFFELFLPVVDDIVEDYTYHQKPKPAATSAESSRDGAAGRAWAAHMEGVKKWNDPHA